MHFHILGVGSIGCLLAHNLRRILPAGYSISLIHKGLRDQIRFLERGSITIEHKGKEERSSDYEHEVFNQIPSRMKDSKSLQLAGKPSTGPIDSLFVTLKAHNVVPAIQAISSRLTSNSTVVLMQNGMGIYEKLLNDVFRNPSQRPHFILASNTHGAFATNFYHVVHAGDGSIVFGIAPDPEGRDFEAGLYDESIPADQRRLRLTDISPPDDLQAEQYKSLRATVAALLLMESLDTSWRSFADLQLLQRRKLAVNAVINPLTALLDCRNGELFEYSQARELSARICDEVAQVFTAQMLVETKSWLQDLQADGVDTSSIQKPTFPSSLTSEALQEEVLRVAAITRQNISSTLQDVRRGRNTEIDFINGYLVDVGREHGVKTPVNSALANLIQLKYLLPLNLV